MLPRFKHVTYRSSKDNFTYSKILKGSLTTVWILCTKHFNIIKSLLKIIQKKGVIRKWNKIIENKTSYFAPVWFGLGQAVIFCYPQRQLFNMHLQLDYSFFLCCFPLVMVYYVGKELSKGRNGWSYFFFNQKVWFWVLKNFLVRNAFPKYVLRDTNSN